MTDAMFKAVWDAAAADVTGLVADLDKHVERHGGDIMFAAMSLARSLDNNSPDSKWLATRLSVALHLMNNATGPLTNKLAEEVAAKLEKLIFKEAR